MQISQQKNVFTRVKDVIYTGFLEHQHGRRVFVLCPNIAAVTSCEKDLFGGNKNLSTAVANPERGNTPPPSPTSYHTRQT